MFYVCNICIVKNLLVQLIFLNFTDVEKFLGINDTAKSSSSKSNIVPENKKIYDLGKNIKSELKNNSTKSFATDVVGPPALTNGIIVYLYCYFLNCYVTCYRFSKNF